MRTLLKLTLLSLVGFHLVGCGSRVREGKVSASFEHLRSISNAYFLATTKMERPPANVEELKPFLKELGGDPDTLLVSPEDGLPYVIFWGVDVRSTPAGGPTAPVLAYELQGKGGRRFVLRVRSIHELTDADLRKAVFPPGQHPPAES